MPTISSLQLLCMDVAKYECFKLTCGDIYGSLVGARPKVLMMQR